MLLHVNRLPDLADDSHAISSLIFRENRERFHKMYHLTQALILALKRLILYRSRTFTCFMLFKVVNSNSCDTCLKPFLNQVFYNTRAGKPARHVYIHSRACLHPTPDSDLLLYNVLARIWKVEK